jgi:hypothetical protein
MTKHDKPQTVSQWDAKYESPGVCHLSFYILKQL